MTELEQIEKIYDKFWGINLHRHRRGCFRYTGMTNDGRIVIGKWGANRGRALKYFIQKVKEVCNV